MALYFKTKEPQKLLDAFKKKIDDRNIVTWSYDSDGDFTHSTVQWKNLAWLRPRIETNRLSFYIWPPKAKKVTVETYAIYHGRFLESMLAHFDSLFSDGTATAMIDGEDKVG